MIEKDDVYRALLYHQGRDNGVSADALVREITGKEPTEAARRALRSAITGLRLEERTGGLVVCGVPATGYYLSDREEDIDETCFWLLARAEKTWTQIARMKGRRAVDVRAQLGLPIKEVA